MTKQNGASKWLKIESQILEIAVYFNRIDTQEPIVIIYARRIVASQYNSDCQKWAFETNVDAVLRREINERVQ